MKLIRYITDVVYGIIIGNWLMSVFNTLTFKPDDSSKRFVVIALVESYQIKMLETNSRDAATYIESLIDETNTATGDVYDTLLPDDKEDLNIESQNIINFVPDDLEEYDVLVGILRLASAQRN